MVEIWFSSDLHLWHENIIKFCNRPFENAQRMSEELLEYHNMFVKPEHHWYNLGDVTILRGSANSRQAQDLIAFIKKFNGHKRLLLGNHDHFPTKVYLEAGFEKIYATWRGIDNILLSHVPIHPHSMGTAVANVHGHTHNNQDDRFPPVIRVNEETKRIMYKPYVNVCVEHTNYRPITLSEVKERIEKLKGEYEANKVGEEVFAKGRPA